MGRVERHEYAGSFPPSDFNEQLYFALRQSPWWMLSLVLHAVAFLVLSTFQSAEPPAAKGPVMHGDVRAEPEPADEQLPPTEEPTEPIHATDVFAQEPVIKEAELSDVDETDNDLDFGQPMGNGEGVSDAPFVGPSSVGLVGIGGGAGGGRNGLGGRRDRRPGGGGLPQPRSEDAVEHALRWLAAHQSPDGRWEAAGFDRWCDGRPVAGQGPDGLGKALYDPGVTGLALCAFLGAGYTHRGNGPFSQTIGRGLRYLRNIQDPEGCFGPRTSQHFIYNHATAALAVVEAYGMTGSTHYKMAAQRALDFISLTRNPYFAWRYGVKPGDNDTSVTGWMMMALKSAKMINEDAVSRGKAAPLEVDTEAFDGIRAWLDKVTDPDYGRVGYMQRGTGPARNTDLVDRFPGEKSESMTAVGVLARVFIGEDPRKSDPIQKGARLMAERLPDWNPADGSIDQYYWYYGTLAMFQVGGEPWKRWNDAMLRAIVAPQRMDGDYCLYKGSWDPIDPWGADGGRVYSTSLMAMCLMVYYRYPRVIGTN